MSDHRADRRDLRLAGLMAAAVALAAAWVATSFLGNVPFPPTALAERIIRITPGDMATFFIDLLGVWALRSLTAGVLIGALALGAEALRLSAEEKSARPGLAGAVLAVLSIGAMLATPTFQPDPLLVTAVGGGAGALYAVIARAVLRNLGDEGPEAADPGRRRVLGLGLGGALGLAVAGGAVGWVLRRLGGPDRNVALVVPQRPARVPTRPPFPRVPGLSPEITSPEDHYTVDVNLVAPSVDASSWELTVGGEVDRPLRLSFEGLQRRFEVVEEFSALACVSNEVGGDLVGHSRWGGVRLRDVLRAAGISAGASDIVLRGADNYSDSIPTDVAMDPHVLIAVSQNGEPLTQEHGFPCRVRVPPIYGMKNVKWLTSIEVVGGDHQGYWQRRGWSDTAEVKTQSRIDVAGSDGDAALGAETWIAGVAWAGDRGISKVDVSVDGGSTWQAADLKAPIAESSWRLWAYRWTPDRRGEVSVVCRATDGRGRVQTSRRVPPHPDGASGLHEVRVTVV